ncbi:MAG: amino acid ABC transporter permease [Spirochaetaceae bacterium]|jgi:L-cystine transport system permease protein|nr:amino acid ABC transporter permease [Spirochaetaceae bacterium]
MEINIAFMLNTFVLALEGIPVTLGLTAFSLLSAIPLGFFLALSRIYRIRALGKISALYVSFMRGTPIVLQILIVYSLLPSLLNALVKKTGSSVNVFDINPFIYALAVFSLNSAAGLAEIFRSAILTVDKGQMEAALSAGLTPAAAYRRIIIPQALVSALPNICNLTVNLIKSTSLAFIMTVKDITAIAKIAASYGYNYIEAYLDIFALYIVICGAAQWLFSLMENRFAVYKKPDILLRKRRLYASN